jgi:hypothetical protein
VKKIILLFILLNTNLVLACPVCSGNYKNGEDEVQEFLKKKSGSLQSPLKTELNSSNKQPQPVCDFRNGNSACKPKTD